MKWQRYVWLAVYALNWVIIGVFWWSGSGQELLSGSTAGILLALGRFSGLAAAYVVLTQFFLMGRTPWLEQVFGLDKLAQLHHLSGRAALPLLLLHLLFVVLGYSVATETGAWEQLWVIASTYEHAGIALIGLLLFIVVAGTSIYLARRRLRYESWYFVHLLAYVAVFLSFWHQIELGTDLLLSDVFYYYWIALYVLVFGAQVLFRIGKPLFYSFRHQFVVERVARETDAVTSVYIAGKNIESYPVQAGQFMVFRFLQKGFWWEAHPFSLSIAPDGKQLRISVKAVGDFTSRIPDLRPGTRVLIDGPYGIFTEKVRSRDKVLLVAGGIGITPLRSLVEELSKKGVDVTLLYGGRTPSEFALGGELEKIAHDHKVNISYVVSHDEEYEGERGYIDREKLERLVPDIAEREVYLCGPAPMMDALLKVFAELGVEERYLHFERFSLH